ncbi:polysaccharide deacetylase family protein [Candidatus Binatus sp.]|uniref:polysaccharide deacetylase family protein n=1 Tax=Candidatus Binatus sp. TaxID=2811406 RepID=UPI003BB09712
MEVALKIDVDTHQGLELGVPRLASMLEREGVAASFYISMGPDNSGRAILRVFRNRGFLSKMFRTKAVSMYGTRTILSGTLLPSRPIALSFPEIIRDLRARGFEVGVHGYDHVRWQDHLDDIGEAGVRNELEDAFEAYRAILGEASKSFAAPGWRTNDAALIALDAMGLDYRSDTRGIAPYRCLVEGRVLATPEIPTTLPTLDEVMGRRDLSDDDAVREFYLSLCTPDALNVHTIHAETEGMGRLENFTELIRALKERGATFVQLREVSWRLNRAELPTCEVVRTTLPGRAGWISAQGPARVPSQ